MGSYCDVFVLQGGVNTVSACDAVTCTMLRSVSFS